MVIDVTFQELAASAFARVYIRFEVLFTIGISAFMVRGTRRRFDMLLIIFTQYSAVTLHD